MEKQAGLDGLLKTIKDFASNNKEMIIGGLAGSGLGALGGYNLVDDYGLSEDEAYNARLRGGIIGGLTGLLGGGLAGHLVGTAGGAAAAGSGGENDKPKLENTPTPNGESAPAPKGESVPASKDNEARVSTEADGPDEDAPKAQESGNSDNVVGAVLDGSHEPAGGYGVTAVGGAVGTGAGVYAGGRAQGAYQKHHSESTRKAKNKAQSAKTKAVMDRGKYVDATKTTNNLYRDIQSGKVTMIDPATGKVYTKADAGNVRRALGKAVAPEMKAYNKTVAETAAAYNKALAKQVKATATLKKAPRLAGRTGGGIIGGLIGLGSTLLGQNAVDYSQGE